MSKLSEAYSELAAPVLMVRPPGPLAERAKDMYCVCDVCADMSESFAFGYSLSGRLWWEQQLLTSVVALSVEQLSGRWCKKQQEAHWAGESPVAAAGAPVSSKTPDLSNCQFATTIRSRKYHGLE